MRRKENRRGWKSRERGEEEGKERNGKRRIGMRWCRGRKKRDGNGWDGMGKEETKE